MASDKKYKKAVRKALRANKVFVTKLNDFNNVFKNSVKNATRYNNS